MRFRIADNLVIDSDRDVVRRQGLRIAVIGESGSGKSWLMAVIAEQAIQQGLQVVFFDVHGEYITFAEVFENVLVIGGDGSDLPLSVDAIEAYRKAYEKGFCLDINLKEYIADEYEYNLIVEKILRALWKSQVNRPKPALWVFEEAHMIAPQERSREVMRRISLVKGIALGGRKFGVSLILGTQRPAEISKSVLSQAYIRFFGKLTEYLDRRAVEDYLKPLKSDVLKSLKTGQFYVYGWFDEPRLIHVTSKRMTRHGAETPLVKPITRAGRVKRDIEELKEMVQEAIARKREEEEERSRLTTKIRELEKLLETERKEKEQLLKEIDKLKLEIDVLSRVRGVDKLAIERAVMEVKELSIPANINQANAGLLDRVKALEEENARLKEELERLRSLGSEMREALEVDERGVREWVENLKSRLRAFASSPQRRKFLKILVSLGEDRPFYPAWMAYEVGVSVGTAQEYLRVLRNTFKITLPSREAVSMVETMRGKRRVLYRNNLRDYIRTCLEMITPKANDILINHVVNDVLSFIYSL